MHHLRSGAQNQQPTGAFGSLMTLIMARNTFPPWEGCGQPGRVREGRMGARPPKTAPLGGEGTGGHGEVKGAGPWERAWRSLAGGVEGEEGSWGRPQASEF